MWKTINTQLHNAVKMWRLSLSCTVVGRAYVTLKNQKWMWAIVLRCPWGILLKIEKKKKIYIFFLSHVPPRPTCQASWELKGDAFHATVSSANHLASAAAKCDPVVGCLLLTQPLRGKPGKQLGSVEALYEVFPWVHQPAEDECLLWTLFHTVASLWVFFFFMPLSKCCDL